MIRSAMGNSPGCCRVNRGDERKMVTESESEENRFDCYAVLQKHAEIIAKKEYHEHGSADALYKIRAGDIVQIIRNPGGPSRVS